MNAPPMTYAVNGKQFIAIASGACCVRPSGRIANSKARIARTPELRAMSQATVLYVFGLWGRDDMHARPLSLSETQTRTY
jgi:alcohol dehydrogenase (cytochrome c)